MLRLARIERYISKLPMEGITPLKVRHVERKLFSTDDILKIGTEARPKVDDKIVEVLTANGQPMTAEAIVQSVGAVGGVFSPWKIKNVLRNTVERLPERLGL